MKPGELRNRIEIQYSEIIENEILEKEKTWLPFKKAWAKIKCVGNGRKQIEHKEVLSLKYEITIRYTKGITTDMRVVYGDRKYNIDHVVNYNELNKELHLLCTVQEEGVYNE